MKRILAAVVVVMFLIGTAMAVQAQGSTRDQALAMVEKAVAFIKANGKDKAMAEFNNPKGQFVKGELFIFVQNMQGVVLAHGGNPKLVGQNLYETKDATGKFFTKEMVDVAKTKGKGWVSYSWTNPVTKKVQPKDSYVQRVDDVYVGCGYFK